MRVSRATIHLPGLRGVAAGWPARLAGRAGLVLLMAALPATGNHARADSPPLPKQERHKLVHLVRQDCGACHGMTLKGGLGKPLLPDALAGRDADTLASIILDGIPGTPMPPWRGLLTEQQARWIARRLKEGFPHETP